MDKVKQLEKYIEPLRRMITKIGTDDQVSQHDHSVLAVKMTKTLGKYHDH